MLYRRLATHRVHVASVIKVPVAMLFLYALTQQGIPDADLPVYLTGHGQGRTYAQLLEAMLVRSEEQATATLLTALRRSDLDVAGTLAAWGAPRTDVYTRYAPPEEIARLFVGLYRGAWLGPQARRLLLTWLSAYTPNDDTRFGVLRPLLPPGGMIFNKRGSLAAERLVVADAGLLVFPWAGEERVYAFALFGYGSEQAPTTYERLEAGLEQAARVFWAFVLSEIVPTPAPAR